MNNTPGGIEDNQDSKRTIYEQKILRFIVVQQLIIQLNSCLERANYMLKISSPGPNRITGQVNKVNKCLKETAETLLKKGNYKVFGSLIPNDLTITQLDSKIKQVVDICRLEEEYIDLRKRLAFLIVKSQAAIDLLKEIDITLRENNMIILLKNVPFQGSPK